jgi:hypothetical protein
MTSGRILLLVMAGFGVIWFIASRSIPEQVPSNAGWRVIGGFPAGETKFVEIDPEHAKRPASVL